MVRKLIFLITALFFLNISFLNINLGNTYYAAIIFALIILLLGSSNFRVNRMTIFFLFCALFSILLNNIPSFFKSPQRLGVFIIVVALIGPLISNSIFDNFKTSLFAIINKLNIYIVAISSLGLIGGLTNFTNTSGFTGVFNHSMMLGPMAVIALLTSMFYFFKVSEKKMQRLYLLTSFLSFYACIAAASRGAIIAGIAGIIFFFYSRHKYQLSKFFRTVLIGSLIILLSFPLWKSKTSALINKIEFSERQGDITASRNELWEERIAEFKTSPIYGIGFGSVDVDISDDYDSQTGKIEPGSSWLALLAMTGLFGFFILSLFILNKIYHLYKKTGESEFTSYLGALLIFFIFHFMGEGYLLAAGSGLFFYFWLLLGVVDIVEKDKNDAYIEIVSI